MKTSKTTRPAVRTKSSPAPRTQQERSDQTRARILETAIGIFGEHGLEGARTEKIAAECGVNKALLYYYFRSKEKLYDAAVELAVDRAIEHVLARLEGRESAGERLVRYALDHFDRLHARQSSHKLLHQELMRMKKNKKGSLPVIAKKLFLPMTKRLGEMIREGQRKKELIDCDPWQLMNAALGANTFYFLSAPVSSLMAKRDPLGPPELKRRRKLAVEHLGLTIFLDRAQGARVAKRVLDSTPMPASNAVEHWRFHVHYGIEEISK